ncbi:NAD/NADP-dependent octopine/nopaline dehydrogenase family protein [Thermincola potens]|uniref:NAD/NADP octopine/nopaline dehydrogenase n=1 Tax=Thermincola potens (strain JR) TaxID=635013 RepID=D5XAP7_THEPJ|nr:NAD/NADP-dependent octopine/nopaline dehydrogenase family protein [Thermincola potens]ADG83251.1 NAD/NADP octopine/nopaline dehydrogenase [Thermincola potens JR]
MDVAVLGGGNGAYAAAADLAEKGHRVRLWRRDITAFKPVLEKQALFLKDYEGHRKVNLAMASDDLGAVIRDAELIMIPLPAFTQDSLVKRLEQHLKNGQVILMTPGTFGSYIMAKGLIEEGCRAEVVFAETGTLPYLARKHGPDTVAITARATRLPTGVFPANKSAYAFDIIKRAFPAVEPLQDALDGALMNAGPIIHPPLILLNAGPIEHFDYWDIHNEGTQPSIRRVHDALDAERIAVREALGYGPPHFPLADHYNPDGEEWMYGNAAHEKLVDSADWRESLDLLNHRYMREDIACGLALLVSIADWVGVPVPVATGLLNIASAIVGENLRVTGRTLENLGLNHLSREEMRLMLDKGLLYKEVLLWMTAKQS